MRGHNKIVRCISADGSVVVSALDSTDIVAGLEQTHSTSAVITAALGRLTTGALLMAAGLKSEKDNISLRITGDGPARSLLAVANGKGEVKAYPQVPVVDLPLNKYGKLDVGGAVGAGGFLSVIRDTGLKQPYIGNVETVSGEIGDDITNYYATSEQTPTVCGLGVLVNPDLTVRSAGGFLLHLLPFADPAATVTVEENLKTLPPVSSLFESHSALEVAQLLLRGLEPNALDETPASLHCDCSLMRVESAIVSLGLEEIKGLIDDKRETEVNCHFCNKNYTFSKEHLQSLYKNLARPE